MANANLLEEKRKLAGKTKSHLAKALKVSRTYVYKLLNSPENMTYGQAETMRKELNISSRQEMNDIFLP